jgi:KaiC/GvpD/RAD55 family RecA-like ATPase
MDDSTESVATAGGGPSALSTEELARALGVSPEAAARLQKSGYVTAESARRATDPSLRAAGASDEDIRSIRRSTPAFANSAVARLFPGTATLSASRDSAPLGSSRPPDPSGSPSSAGSSGAAAPAPPPSPVFVAPAPSRDIFPRISIPPTTPEPERPVESVPDAAPPADPPPVMDPEPLATVEPLSPEPEIPARVEPIEPTPEPSPAEVEPIPDEPRASPSPLPASPTLSAPESSGRPPAKSSSPEADRIVERWAGSVRRPERAKHRKVATTPKESTDVLRKWVDGDDRAMEDWIRASEPTVPLAAVAVRPSPAAEPRRPAEPAAGSAVLEREETVVRWLTGLLDRVKSDQFDPTSMIQEVQDLHRQLYDERAKRKQLEDEVEHVKRGSIAVIKYVRSREAKEKELAVQSKDDEIAELKLRLLALEGVGGERASGSGSAPAAAAAAAGVAAANPVLAAGVVEKATRELDQHLREEFAEREHEYIERETELRRRIVQLEGENRNLASEAERTRDREQLIGKDQGALSSDVRQRLEEATQREKDLVARENELRARFEEIKINSEELERRRSSFDFKEHELAAFDTQLQTRRQALDIEARRLEQLRRETDPTVRTQGDEARRLEDMHNRLSEKEADLRGRETLLQTRLQELERMAGVAAEAEARQIHDDASAAAQEVKVRSGVRRLDDLLYGGYPLGAQILVNGPAHTGKDVLARLFSVEGLKLGIPSIWIVTDKTHQQVRDDLAGLFPGFAESEKKEMVRYVDLYSRAVGSTGSTPTVRLLSSTDKAVLDQLATSVNEFGSELKEKYSTYRLIFESVSTITAYLDTASTFRFLQPFVGRRRIDSAVSYYELDSGMHSESDLETLEHMVDGSINLKNEQLKTFLSVRGITDVQARAWVGYTFNKRSFNLGSFSLEHIR